MTTTAADIRVRDLAGSRKLAGAVRDGLAVTWRNLIGYRRVPQLLIFSTIQPVVFVLLFRYVFGGSVRLTGPISYVDYLMPGVFVQTAVFGAMATAIGLAADLKSGLLERFRSLPMARSAVLVGRTTADLSRNIFVGFLMALVGFAVGFRVHTNPLAFLAGLAVMLLFGYALSWIFATLGLAVGDPETAQAAAFPVIAPLVFASSAFVEVSHMPGWLQPFARNQPVTVTVDAVRALMVGGPTTSIVLKALAWSIGVLLVFIPISVRRYRRAV